MSGKVHPDDLLLVGLYAEHQGYPFPRRQVLTVTGLRLQLRGRRWRRMWITDMAFRQMDSRDWAELDVSRVRNPGSEIHSANLWRPEPEPTLAQRISAGLGQLIERVVS